MAFKARDGKQFSMASQMNIHNRGLGQKAPGSVLEAPAGSDGEDEMGENPEPKQVVEEHGPAHSVHIQHDHEAGEHEVHSEHPDGHKHHSKHGSAAEAHDHAKQLAGADEEPEEEPSGENDGEEEEDSY